MDNINVKAGMDVITQLPFDGESKRYAKVLALAIHTRKEAKDVWVLKYKDDGQISYINSDHFEPDPIFVDFDTINSLVEWINES